MENVTILCFPDRNGKPRMNPSNSKQLHGPLSWWRNRKKRISCSEIAQVRDALSEIQLAGEREWRSALQGSGTAAVAVWGRHVAGGQGGSELTDVIMSAVYVAALSGCSASKLVVANQRRKLVHGAFSAGHHRPVAPALVNANQPRSASCTATGRTAERFYALAEDLSKSDCSKEAHTDPLQVLDGRDSYRRYIRSKRWLRSLARLSEIAAAGAACRLCGRDRWQARLEVHHRCYRRLGCEHAQDLTLLCRECHSQVTAFLRARRVQPKPPIPVSLTPVQDPGLFDPLSE